MAGTKDLWTDLYTPLFDVMLLAVFEEYELVCETLFTVEEDDSEKVEKSQMSGFGIWNAIAEGEGITQEEHVQMYNESYTHGEFGDGFNVTFNALKDDEYAVLKRMDNPKVLGVGSRARLETDSASILENAFDTGGSYNWGDGVSLCNDSHPKNPDETGTVYDNKLSGSASVLGETALTAMEVLFSANCKTPKGIKVEMPRMGYLVVPFALYDEALRLVAPRAIERPNTAARDINIYAKGKESWVNYTVIPWQYLDTATQWFVIYPSLEPLCLIYREKPYYDSWVDRDNRRYNFEGAMRFSVGVNPGGWRGVWGSAGA